MYVTMQPRQEYYYYYYISDCRLERIQYPRYPLLGYWNTLSQIFSDSSFHYFGGVQVNTPHSFWYQTIAKHCDSQLGQVVVSE